jgi:hypothetical protein
LDVRTELVSTPVVSTAPAYTAGDSVGTKITLLNAVLAGGGEASLKSVTITDLSNQKPTLEILIFNSDPTGTTFTDNGALTLASADLAKVIARVTVAAGDWVTVGTRGVASLALDRVLVASGATNTTLYACLMATGTPTFTGTSDITLRLGIEQH